jgi:hypothetical protein
MTSTHEQLVDLLAQLGDRAVAEKEACRIHAAMLALSRGHDIGQDDSGFYARPRYTKPVGLAKEIRDLAATARKAIRGKISREDWMREWAAQPPSVWRTCRSFLLEPGTRSLDRAKLLGNFSAPPADDTVNAIGRAVVLQPADIPSQHQIEKRRDTHSATMGDIEDVEQPVGFAIVVPKPEAVLPALEVALELRRIVTGNKKQRKADPAAHEVIAVVRSAYSALTGKRGGRAILPSGQAGRLVRLGRDIDRLFGTKIFPKVDSTRLKKKTGDKKPLRRAK